MEAMMARFWCPFFGMCLIASSAVLVVGAAWAQATKASGQPMPQTLVVTDNIAFSWPIVVMVVVSALGYAGVVASVRAHHADGRCHLTATQVAEAHRTRAECLLEHGNLTSRLDGIEKSLADIYRLLIGKGE